MDLGIRGRRALVTGASSGLGLATAAALAEEGVEVVLASRNAARLAEATAALPGRHHPVVADLADPGAIEPLVDNAEAVLEGHIDILVANAGGPPPGDFASTEVSAYPEALQLNLLSTIALCKRIVPGMRERGWGRVIAITSTAVREPMAQIILSNTARAGVTAFLKTAAREVAADGVTVNTVQPGVHLTDRLRSVYPDLDSLARTQPSGRIGDPDDFGAVVAFLCSAQANYISGVSLAVDAAATRGLL